MRKIVVIGIAGLFILSVSSALWVKPSPQNQQKAREAYAQAAAVTENHKLFTYFVGRWNVTSKMWQFPGTPLTVSKNSGEVISILGGRFFMTKFKGPMMGQPFEGLQVDGYDNLPNKFQTFWVDNSSTTFYPLSGTYDAKTKTWNATGRWADPTGGMTPVRTVTRVAGPDEYFSEMSMTMPAGKEFKSLENHCLRKKMGTKS